MASLPYDIALNKIHAVFGVGDIHCCFSECRSNEMDPLQQGDRFVFHGGPEPPTFPSPLPHSDQGARAASQAFPPGWTSHSEEPNPLPPGLLPTASPSSDLTAPETPSLQTFVPVHDGNGAISAFQCDSFVPQYPLAGFSAEPPSVVPPCGEALPSVVGVETTAYASQFVPLPSLTAFSPIEFHGAVAPPAPVFLRQAPAPAPAQVPVCVGNGVGQPQQGQRFLSRIPPSEPPSEKGPLHDEIQQFSRGCLPTDKEAAAMDSLLRDLDRRIHRMFPQATDVLLYGSQATGLALPCSDLDIVILGVGTQIFAPAEQFSAKDKKRVMQKLQHLQDNLERNDHLEVGKCKVVPARVPVMKATLKSKGLEFKTDISMGVQNAAAAVGLICQHVSQNPAIRPLVLVLKAVLKKAGLNEVFTGGISSYVLFNLVVAHLMLEGVICDQPMQPGTSLSDMGTMIKRTKALADQVDLCVWDLGYLLLSFLERYGNWREPRNNDLSISIAKGGLCLKQCLQADDSCLLCVEDPQALGRNATGGSFKMGAVLDTFQEAATKLRAAMDGNSASVPKDAGFKILSSVIPCDDIIAHIPIASPARKPNKSNPVKRGNDGKANKRRHNGDPFLSERSGCPTSRPNGGAKSRKCHRDARPMDRFVMWKKTEKEKKRRF